jgi:hypothetical protein
MKKIALLLVGILLASLGGLWLVQGLGVVHLEPIACVADCKPIQGSSPTYAVLGALMVAAGGLAIVFGLQRKR